jgi:omega-6 fatty acid desaturase (delta-12 desaturase)
MTSSQANNATLEPVNYPWQKAIAKYQNPQLWRSSWQLINTLVPYAVVWYLMVLSLKVSYWLTLALTVVAAGFVVRLFIIFHDCGHGSFFKSQKANRFWGFVTGLLTFTPNSYWWREHAQHHASAGNLDDRGVGDIWTMTVQEYLKSPLWKRIQYRMARNPLCLFIIGPSILFLFIHRFSDKKSSAQGIRSVQLTNLGILGIGALMSSIIGLQQYIMIQLPIVMIAASAGVWLFYVQHQFEGVYWERDPNWDYVTEALKGSSFYKLPKVLQWFTGSIGFHHIHHLSPKIPNYYLEKCYKEIPLFQEIKPVTFFASLKSLTFRLWDEQHQRLVGFGYLKELRQSTT